MTNATLKTSYEGGTGQARTAYFDYLRIFATFCIMLVHVAAYQWYNTDVHTTAWKILDVYKGITRPAVLLFIMISGALFLGRQIPVKKLYSKYILRLVIAFVFWDIVYAVVTSWRQGFSGILFKALNSNYHLWFLLAIIGLYICVPLLRLIAERPRLCRYFMILSVIFAFVFPEILSLLKAFSGDRIANLIGIAEGRLNDMHVEMVLGYAFYFLAGHYIHTTDLQPRARTGIYIAGIAAAILGAFLNIFCSVRTGLPSELFHTSFTLHEMLQALAMFTFFRYNVKGAPGPDRFAARLSLLSFGAYLVHDLVILRLDAWLGLNALTFHPLAAVPMIGLAAFIISFAISALLNLIPGVNKYIV